ncbi:terminase large subunit [Bosea sp. RCC_152_1]|uniref:terminase large subunit n=1 Tax=Bosea sp. RCC_152_1 TaxID=3239228 RepID=UPI003524C673
MSLDLPPWYPHWIYDDSPIDDPFGFGANAVKFVRSLKHPSSRLPGYAFEVNPWIERIILAAYGPRYEADILDEDGLIIHRRGERIVNELPLILPRGARKTTIAAALACLHLFGPEADKKRQCIFAAGDREQANVGFAEVVGIIEAGKRLAGKFRVYDAQNSPKKIIYSELGSTLQAVSADGRLQHGKTPNFVLADEIHVWPPDDNELMKALETGLGKTSDRMLVIASTAGRGSESYAYRRVERYKKIAAGEIVAPNVLPVLFMADGEADWRNPQLWRAMNPGMRHGYPPISTFKEEEEKALSSPFDLDDFKQLRLNIWLAKTTSPFIDMGVYDKGNAPIDLNKMKGLPCWLGVDLSNNDDLTVISAIWRDEGGRYYVQPHFYCPQDNVEKRTAKGFPYRHWAKDNKWITATPGSVIDLNIVEGKIRELHATYGARQIAFDPALAQGMMQRLLADDLPAVAQPQRPFNMAAPYQELERAILGEKLHHSGHPVLRWNFENAQRIPTETGFIQISKKRSKEKIDGMVATAMAIGCAVNDNMIESIFSKPDELLDIYKKYA